MARRFPTPEEASEPFLAELTDAAYQVALKHGLRGSFLDVQLDLWSKLRGVLETRANIADEAWTTPPVVNKTPRVVLLCGG